MKRARSLSVLGILLAGVIGLIASTQTWFHVSLRDVAASDLTVAGSAALALLTPFSLAALALGIALSIVGRVVRYVFGVLAVAIGATMLALSIPLVTGSPISAVAPSVSEATGIAGESSVADLVAAITPTVWPVIGTVAWLLLLACGIFVLATASAWPQSGRKYAATQHAHVEEGPLDAVDSWDDLSRGDDPTT